MVAIVREDAPWAWGYWPYVALAFQPWVHNGKPSILVRDLAKYYRIDPAMRVAKQAEWNHPVRWPLALIALALALLVGLGRGAACASSPRRSQECAAPCGLDGHLTMLNYLIRRIGYGVLILHRRQPGFTFVLFFTVNTPDDMARLNIGGKRVTQEQIEKWKAERGYDKPLYWNKAKGQPRSSPKTIFWERSVSLFALRFGRCRRANAGDIGHEVKTRMGVSLQLACRCSCCRSSPARPSRCCWCSSATRGSTSGAWCCAC
jgi:hypothetical protein